MTGPMIRGCESLCNPRARVVRPRLDQFDEFTKRIQVESERRAAGMLGVPGSSEVGPVPGHCEGSALGITQDQRVDTGYTPGLQYSEALAATRMEGMSNLSPSRKGTGRMCS